GRPLPLLPHRAGGPVTVTAPLSTAVPRPARSQTLLIRPWADEVIDALGFDPRSNYVEKYWLGVLGPSSRSVRPQGWTRRPARPGRIDEVVRHASTTCP